MNTAKLEIVKSSLPLNQRSSELIHHLHLVSNEYTQDLTISEIQHTDDCKVYYKGALLCITSTQELNMLIKLGDLDTMELVKVQAIEEEPSKDTNGQSVTEFYAAVHKDILARSFVGVMTNSKSQVTAFVRKIGNTYWGMNSTRLFQIDFEINEAVNTKSSQEAIRYINKHKSFFKNQPDSIILF